MSPSEQLNQWIKRLSKSKYPLSIFLRWIVLIGVSLRVGTSAIVWGQIRVEPWLVPLLLFLVYTISITYIIGRYPGLPDDRRVFLFVLITDTIFCTVFFSMGGNADSDLFLNYILPIVVVIEQDFSPTVTLGFYGIICAAFFVGLTWIDVTCSYGCSLAELIVRGFLPRITIGLFVILFSLVRRTRFTEL